MRALLVGAFVLLIATSAQAAAVSYNFFAQRTFLSPDSPDVSGVVDALRPLEEIRGRIIFDLSVQLAEPEFTSYGKPTVLVDGIDTTAANARVRGLFVQLLPTNDNISSAYEPFGDLPSEQADIVVFLAFDFTGALLRGEQTFPDPLTPLVPTASYLLSFETVLYENGTFPATEGATYSIVELTPVPVPLPASAAMLLGAVAAFVGVRAGRKQKRA